MVNLINFVGLVHLKPFFLAVFGNKSYLPLYAANESVFRTKYMAPRPKKRVIRNINFYTE